MRCVLNHIRAGLLALGVLVGVSAGSSTHAQTTISNVATVEYRVGTTTIVRDSNRVDIAIGGAATKITLETFHFSGAANAQRVTVGDTVCRGVAGAVPVMLDGAFAGMPLSPANVERTSQIRAGEPLIVAITSAEDNRDRRAIDMLVVTLTTPAGDAETLVLRESGIDSGYFVGVVRTAAVPPAPIRGDCLLSVKPGEILILSTSRENGSLVATAPVDVLIDPFGVAFDSGDGAPVQDVRVTLIDVDTGQPAIVFGDDAVSRYPSTLLTGSTVTDASGATYRFPPGDYRFPFVKPGRYRLQVEPPTPYSAPSRSPPAEIALLRRPDGEPFTIAAASYGGIVVLNDPQPVRIDIPLDRPGAALELRKTASVAVAVPGDGVQYRIVVTNGDAARTTGAVTVTDLLPASMRLKPNTVRAHNVVVPYSVSSDGLRLTIPLAPLAARASTVVTYLLEVRPDAPAGQTMNSAGSA